MASYPTDEPVTSDISPWHQALCERVVQLHAEHRPPTSASSRTDCGELLGQPLLGYTGEVTPLRSYARQLVSWPDVGNRPGWLADRLTARDQSILFDRDSLALPQPELEG
eukprot:792912-Pyramimonas_sp.AAC.1